MKNKKYPSKPTAHITGEQSVLALRNAIPKQWIFRETMPDYGIDFEIEIVDDDGNVTGAIIKGQVKGTSSVVKKTRKSLTIDINSVRYWLALPIPIILIRVCTDPLEIRWIDVREYLDFKGLIDSIYQSKKSSIYFSFKNARTLPETTQELMDLGLDHQFYVNDMRENIENIFVEYIRYRILVYVFDCDPDKWLKYLREKGSDEKIIEDFPFAFWVKEQSKRDPDLLNRIRQMVYEDS